MDTLANPARIAQHIEAFRKIVGENYVFVDEESLETYAHDETENLHYPPEAVIKPRTVEEISAIMKICNKERIPVTPRGGGTGLSGGALAHLGGVILSMERMNAIIEIDERNLAGNDRAGRYYRGITGYRKREEAFLSS